MLIRLSIHFLIQNVLTQESQSNSFVFHNLLSSIVHEVSINLIRFDRISMKVSANRIELDLIRYIFLFAKLSLSYSVFFESKFDNRLSPFLSGP